MILIEVFTYYVTKHKFFMMLWMCCQLNKKISLLISLCFHIFLLLQIFTAHFLMCTIHQHLELKVRQGHLPTTLYIFSPSLIRIRNIIKRKKVLELWLAFIYLKAHLALLSVSSASSCYVLLRIQTEEKNA